MKLKEYFDEKRKTSISGGDRLEIYQNFISKRNSKPLYQQRRFFYVKSFAYSLVLLFLLLGLYGTYIFNGKFIINKDGFFIQRSNGIKSVQADYIAKVIEFNGNFYIGHNGEYYQGSYIANGDMVTLQNGAELIFHIDQGTEAKILGPAKFLISKGDNNYKLNLIYGNFVELKSLKQDDPQNIELSTASFTVKQSDKTKLMSFQLIKQGEKTLLKNNGPQLIITQNKTESQKELNQDKILSIQDNDISIINDEKLSQAIFQKNFTQTVAFENTQTNEEDLDAILNKEYSQEEANDEIVNNIGLSNDKNIPTEDQIQKLRSNMSKSSILSNIKSIKGAYLAGNASANIVILDNKLKQVCGAFKISCQNLNGTEVEKLGQLINNAKKLYSSLSEKYHIPPAYMEPIKDIFQELTNIQQ